MRTTQIHSGKYYAAFLIKGDHGGIVVSSKRKSGGTKLPNNHSQFASYLECFEAGDSVECDALCRALLEG